MEPLGNCRILGVINRDGQKVVSFGRSLQVPLAAVVSELPVFCVKLQRF